MTGIYTHHNRHAGFYVSGNAMMPPPYNFADHVSLQGSRADDNNLDNAAQTWDDVDFDRRTSNGLIGGPNAGDGNELTGGDVLLSCSPMAAGCSGTIGPFRVQGNTVTDVNQGGVRAYGKVSGVTITGNTLNVTKVGIVVSGSVTDLTISHNAVNGAGGYGIDVIPLPGLPPGNNITIRANNVKMGDIRKPGFAVVGATNVTLENNKANGASYDTSQAGAGLVVSGNHWYSVSMDDLYHAASLIL